jgi:hypothetical protein
MLLRVSDSFLSLLLKYLPYQAALVYSCMFSSAENLFVR